MPRALITGITGQDGSYLTELLLEKGYEVHGVVRPGQASERTRLKHLVAAVGKKLFLHEAALEDSAALKRVITQVAPDELYHLASMTHVGLGFWR